MLRERGVHVLGEALSGEAATVRPGEKPLVTDGPFAETKEAVGGFYVVDCASRDEALELAAKAPPSPGVAVEVLGSPTSEEVSPAFPAQPAAAATAPAIARYPASVGCGSPFEQMKVSAQSRAFLRSQISCGIEDRQHPRDPCMRRRGRACDRRLEPR